MLAGCGGGSASNPFSPSASNGYFRFVNGSADAGAVDVYVDGALLKSDVAYGGITAYVEYKAGAHTIAIDQTGTKTAIANVSTSSLSQSVNGGQYVSLVLVGEEHPVVTTDTPNLLAFNDQVYDTPSGGAAVDFHDAANVTGSATTQFSISNSTGNQNLGSAVNVGIETQPVGIPSSFVGSGTTAVTFTATPSSTGIPAATLQPSTIDPQGCAANTLPCNSGNLSVYFIDGPAASTTPAPAPYPTGVSATQQATMVGIFDANGT